MLTLNTEQELLKKIIEHSFDEIFITDENGMVLDVSPSCYELYGVTPDEIIGNNVYSLEERGILNPSVSALIIKNQKPVTIIQETQMGKKVLVSGYPIFSEGKLKHALSFSRDITEIETLKERNEQVAETLEIYKKEVERIKNLESFLFQNAKMNEIMNVVSKVANLDVIVLIEGESGVGKSRIAQLLHSQSLRAEEPFVEVNCGAIPEALFESELFGYDEGAFTGAKRGGKPGYFELAKSGTIFLDEIAELPPNLQVKLLSVLQNRKVTRVGGHHTFNLDCRIICATNQNLKEMVDQKKFREDLYYRIDVVKLFIPPLRERKEEILTLIYEFTKEFNQKYSLNKRFSTQMLEYLSQKEWPGNVRELRNFVEKTIITSNDDIIDIPHQEYNKKRNESSLASYMEAVEKEYIQRMYKDYPNSILLAKTLNISQSTANRKIQKYIQNR